MAVTSWLLVSVSAPSVASAKIAELEKGAVTWLKRSPGTVDYEKKTRSTYIFCIKFFFYDHVDDHF